MGYMKHKPWLNSKAGFRLLLSMLLWTISIPVQAQSLDDLVSKVPSWMNSICIVNVQQINKSPRGVKENWAKTHQSEYMAGASNIPPWANVVVIGGLIDPIAVGNSQTVVLIPLTDFIPFTKIAKRDNTEVQMIAGQSVLLSPRHGYIAQVGPRIGGASRTMPRQLFARWLQYTQTAKKPALSPFLTQTLNGNKNAEVFFSVDTKDMVDPAAARIEIVAAQVVKPEILNGMVTTVSGLEGITFVAKFDLETKAHFVFQFSRELGPYSEAMIKFLPQVINRFGAEIKELEKATFVAKGKQVTVDTPISDASLRRILSILSPSSAGEILDSSLPTKGSGADLRYYRAVTQILDDLKQYRGPSLTAYNRAATWYDTYANKIDHLSIQNVDADVSKFGYSVSAKLRSLAASLRGSKMAIEAYESYTSIAVFGSVSSPFPFGGYGYGYGYYGGGYGGGITMDSNLGTIRNKQADIAAKLGPEREKVWLIIDQDRAKIRQMLTDKYKIDPEQYRSAP